MKKINLFQTITVVFCLSCCFMVSHLTYAQTTIRNNTETTYDFSSGNLLFTIINTEPPEVALVGHAHGQEAIGRLWVPTYAFHNNMSYQVTQIGENAFLNCVGLTGVLIINTHVREIKQGAFQGCGFTDILVLDGIETIHEDAFSETNLQSVMISSPNPPTLVKSSDQGLSRDIRVCVPSSCLEAYQSAPVWEEFTNICPMSFWDGSVAEAYDGGDGSEENPYQIANAPQLALLGEQTNNGTGGDACYILTDDICLYGSHSLLEWTPIGGHFWDKDNWVSYFSGRFDGNGKVIAGLYSTIADNHVTGLFGCADNAVIHSVNLKDIVLASFYYSGGLVGHAGRSVISNCSIENSEIVLSDCLSNLGCGYAVGGIAGAVGEPYTWGRKSELENPRKRMIDTCVISNCYVARNVVITGTMAGGVVGVVNDSDGVEVPCVIKNCENWSNVMSFNGIWSYITTGGIAGMVSRAMVLNCVNHGNVFVGDDVYSSDAGGIVGSAFSSSVCGCVNYGNVEGKQNSGGIVGYFAYNTQSNRADSLLLLRDCHNYGDLKVYSGYNPLWLTGGGVVGRMNANAPKKCFVVDCSNHGEVNVEGNCAAGIVGFYSPNSWKDLYVLNVYNTGNITSLANSSGVLSRFGGESTGSMEIFVRNVYNTGEIHGDTTSGHPAIIHSTEVVDDIADCYWLANDQYTGNGPNGPELQESCAFHPLSSPTEWRLDSVRYGTVDLLRALNAGAETIETLFPEVGVVSRWSEDTSLENNGFPVFGEYFPNDSLAYPFLGTEWYYEIQNPNGAVTYQYLECTSDTTVNSHRAKVIVRTNKIYDKDEITIKTHEYLFEENDVVYWWNQELQTFTVLYDFAANLGDQWEIKVGIQSIVMHVDTVETVEHDGKNFRLLRVSDPGDLFSGDILCGVGHLTSFFPERLMRINQHNDPTKDFTVESLRCYWNNDKLVYFVYIQHITPPIPTQKGVSGCKGTTIF